MANASKAKGSFWAKTVCAYLATHGFPMCERRVDGGTKDRGDVAGVYDTVIECKATREIDLASAMTEAKRQAANAGASIYLAVIKRRNHTVERAYAVFELEQATELLRIRELLMRPGYEMLADQIAAKSPDSLVTFKVLGRHDAV